MTELDRAIEMLEKVKANLSGAMTPTRSDELRHEISDLLTELGHIPPERLPIGVYTLEQAGNILSLSPSTLRGQVGKGRLNGTMFGKTWVVTKDEIARYRMQSLGRIGRPSAVEAAKTRNATAMAAADAAYIAKHHDDSSDEPPRFVHAKGP